MFESILNKTIEHYARDFVAQIRRISQLTGNTPREVFSRWVDWSFWLTMAQTRLIAERMNKESAVSYSIEECKEKAFSARDFLLEKELGPLFGDMQTIWIEASLTHKEEFGMHVVAQKELHGTLNKSGGGQVFTPNTLATLMARMIQVPESISADGTCLDPCSGYGGLLIADWYAGEYMDKPLGTKTYGAKELSTQTAKVCYLNMVCHMMPGVVSNGNSLHHSSSDDWEINPPWVTPLWLMLPRDD